MQRAVVSSVLLSIMILLPCCLVQAEWQTFEKEGLKQAPQIEVLSSNEFSVVIDVDIPGAEVEEIDTRQTTDIGDEVFALFSMGKYTYTADIGKPKLPMVTSILDVPHRAIIDVEVLRADYEETALQTIGVEKRIMPALASVEKVPGERARFVLNEKTYSTDAFYPDKIFAIEEYEGFARGHRLATVKFFPVHYNPVTERIRCYTNIQVKVNFINGDIFETQQTIAKNYSHVWEDFMMKLTQDILGTGNGGFFEVIRPAKAKMLGEDVYFDAIKMPNEQGDGVWIPFDLSTCQVQKGLVADVDFNV